MRRAGTFEILWCMVMFLSVCSDQLAVELLYMLPTCIQDEISNTVPAVRLHNTADDAILYKFNGTANACHFQHKNDESKQ